MKGLLLKDFYMSRKTIWIYLFMIILFAAAQSTNGAIFALFYAIMIPVNLIAQDERDHFDSLLPMLPVSGIQRVLDKYIASWMMVALALVVYFVRCLFPGAQVDLAIVFVSVSIVLISQSISLPLIFRFGVERGRMIYMISIIAQAALLGALGAVWEELLAVVAPWLIMPIVLAVGIAFSIGSIFVSSKVYEKRITA